MSIGRASETTPPAASKMPSTHLPKDYPERSAAPSFAVVSNTTRSMLPSSSSCLSGCSRVAANPLGDAPHPVAGDLRCVPGGATGAGGETGGSTGGDLIDLTSTYSQPAWAEVWAAMSSTVGVAANLIDASVCP
jgi:hypothetical protein